MNTILAMDGPAKHYDKYDAPHIEGYRHAANSGDEKKIDVIMKHKLYYDTNDILVVPFNPENCDESDPIWQYVIKWAIYLPVGK